MPIIGAIIDIFTSFIPGPRLIDGQDCKNLASIVCSSASGLTALAGGGQTGATLLTATYNSVDTVASANDSVMLPLAIPGAICCINNNQASNSLQVFGAAANPNNGGAGDTIAAHNSSSQTATATGVAQGATVFAEYICMKLGQWKQTISA